MSITFHLIPDTDLEIASAGSGNSRMLFIRKQHALQPLDVADGIRVVLIGSPEQDFRTAMADGRISRPKLSELVSPPIGGNTYHRLRSFLSSDPAN